SASTPYMLWSPFIAMRHRGFGDGLGDNGLFQEALTDYPLKRDTNDSAPTNGPTIGLIFPGIPGQE
ncbi:MAG: hypothetical protein KJ675_12835, partial [Gammaproteobacteria bacterium]|nr:hypothetical protein [Gammaproteobacteria bacterium]